MRLPALASRIRWRDVRMVFAIAVLFVAVLAGMYSWGRQNGYQQGTAKGYHAGYQAATAPIVTPAPTTLPPPCYLTIHFAGTFPGQVYDPATKQEVQGLWLLAAEYTNVPVTGPLQAGSLPIDQLKPGTDYDVLVQYDPEEYYVQQVLSIRLSTGDTCPKG